MKTKNTLKGKKSNQKTTMLITFNGMNLKLLRYNKVWVFPSIQYYSDGLGSPIALDLYSYDTKKKEFDLYTGITVNLPNAERSAGCQFINTNNNDPSILDWLEKNDFGKRTGKSAQSGCCTYPEFNFYAGKQFMEYKAVNDKMNE